MIVLYQLFLKEDLEKNGTVYIATEDGSVGTKGNVMNAIEENHLQADVIFACGPMPMLRAIKKYAEEKKIKAYISLEEHMACGVGACLGTLATPLVTTAPRRFRSTNSSYSMPEPKVPDAVKEYKLNADVIYACGPTPMLRALKAYAAEQGMTCYISMEERMACGVGACLGCVCKTTHKDAHSHVNNARICTDGPVFEAREVEI